MSVRMRILRGARAALPALVVAFATGCGAAARGDEAAVAEMNRVRGSAGAKEGAELAPQMHAEAERLRALSLAAQREGDSAAATLYAERASAVYARALVLARRLRAERELDAAAAELARTDEMLRALASERASVEREADALDVRLRVARELTVPAPSGPADASREAARLVAARSLAMQARLLCGAARLLGEGTDTEALGRAEAEIAALEKQLEGAPKATPIDAAARARAGCLSILTKARRGAKSRGVGEADALLAALSAAAGWDPSRDERGVVVALRLAFRGTELTEDARKRLVELGRVAAAHPAFGLQVVVHSATPPTAADVESDTQRARAAVRALVEGGANEGRTQAEVAGAKLPVVDPKDPQLRARNARLEVVFVSPAD
jgi:hypothetical protein